MGKMSDLSSKHKSYYGQPYDKQLPLNKEMEYEEF
jgi:hypothetical protein